MAHPELTEDYLRRLDAVQPKDLPPELDLFDEETSRKRSGALPSLARPRDP